MKVQPRWVEGKRVAVFDPGGGWCAPMFTFADGSRVGFSVRESGPEYIIEAHYYPAPKKSRSK